MSLTIIIIVTTLIWIAVSREAVKPSEEINWRKTITLMSTGSLLTLVLTISLFQDIPFLK
ncbi:hypothetical protein GCM10011409_17490 [Lentibacillus populi]|uniref:Uncharacterized protein n=1 Tax=Lentibacillus populi TaxID=1827502 RepID=A0A9W5TXX1_9BACI|nr:MULTISPECIES: hypothetical protein [Bacillaceae]MBT2214604.1 hypothetical protein [Virgibacillus dakarensis]GGB40490.1 hypothetical protein GCM10011409_17490 [Lentibacillus populi]